MTPHKQPVTLDSRLTVSGEVMVQEVGGEIILLDMASEQYFGLDAIGTRIWQLIGQHDLLRDIHGVLCAQFDAAPDQIATDLVALAQSLQEAGLVHAH